MGIAPRSSLRQADGLHVSRVGDEYLVVDETTQSAHVLRGASAELWAALDSRSLPAWPEAELARQVAELRELGLLANAGSFTRRDVLRQAGTVAVAGAVISIGLPAASAAASSHKPPAAILEGPTEVQPTDALTVTLTLMEVSSPSGTAELLEGATVVATATVTATGTRSGTAAFSLSNLQARSYTYIARHNGLLSNQHTLRSAYTPTVTLSTPITEVGKPHQVVVTVGGPAGTPTGSVTLEATGATPATQTLSLTPTGTATFNITNPTSATGTPVTLKATYAPATGTTTYRSNEATASYTTTAITPTISFVNTPSNSSHLYTKKNTSYTCQVTVAGANGVIPSGNVTLTQVGGATISAPNPAPLDANGKVSFTVTNPNPGGNTATQITLTAAYAGDTRVAQATQSDVTYTLTN